jgi:molybdate transport system substrate-binding protein
VKRGVLGAAVLAIALLLGACGGDDDEGSEVVVSAASSLEPAFTAYADEAGIDAKQSFAGSDGLAAQIQAGARPDVYAAANTTLPDELHADGLVGKPVTFATNRLVLAVPSGSTQVRSVEELSGSGIALAIGAEGVPIGDYTREVLARLGLDESAAILANVRTEEPDVGGIVGKLTQSAVDAGFVYVTDVNAADGELEAIELPGRLQPRVAYGAAVVTGAAHPEAGREFIDGLLSGDGAAAMKAAGFGPPPT